MVLSFLGRWSRKTLSNKLTVLKNHKGNRKYVIEELLSKIDTHYKQKHIYTYRYKVELYFLYKI